MILISCAKTQFKADKQKASTIISKSQTKIIHLDNNDQKLDMVWVIDNSGSMSEEAEQVRINFERFSNSLENKGDFKLALISKTEGSNSSPIMGRFRPVGLPYVELSQNMKNKGHIQIDYPVGSTNLLVALAYKQAAKNDKTKQSMWRYFIGSRVL